MGCSGAFQEVSGADPTRFKGFQEYFKKLMMMSRPGPIRVSQRGFRGISNGLRGFQEHFNCIMEDSRHFGDVFETRATTLILLTGKIRCYPSSTADING